MTSGPPSADPRSSPRWAAGSPKANLLVESNPWGFSSLPPNFHDTKRPPRSNDREGHLKSYGAGGIRTPKSFRTHAFEACALAVLPPLQRESLGPLKTATPGAPTTGRGVRAITTHGRSRGCTTAIAAHLFPSWPHYAALLSGRPDYLRFATEIRASNPFDRMTRPSLSGRPDSNRGPLRPERSALPD